MENKEKPIVFYNSYYAGFKGLFKGEKIDILVWDFIYPEPTTNLETIHEREELLALFQVKVIPPNASEIKNSSDFSAYIQERNLTTDQLVKKYDELLLQAIKNIEQRVVEYHTYFINRHDKINLQWIEFLHKRFGNNLSLTICDCRTDEEIEILRKLNIRFMSYPCHSASITADDVYQRKMKERIKNEKAR